MMHHLCINLRFFVKTVSWLSDVHHMWIILHNFDIFSIELKRRIYSMAWSSWINHNNDNFDNFHGTCYTPTAESNLILQFSSLIYKQDDFYLVLPSIVVGVHFTYFLGVCHIHYIYFNLLINQCIPLYLLQSVTPHLSLGGEVFWAGQHRKSGIGYAARYNTDKMVKCLLLDTPIRVACSLKT